MLEAALDAAGLDRAVIGLGDADLYRQLLTRARGRGRGARRDPRAARRHTTWSASRRSSRRPGIGAEQVDTCVALSQLRGGREVLEQARAIGGAAVERATARIGETFEALEERGVADRVQVDLGLLRDLGYYSGAILEVYDPALGHVLGGGGRYDGLLEALRRRPARGRLRPLPGARPRRPDGGGVAAGGARRERRSRRHRRRARPDGPLKLAVPRGALLEGTLDALDARRRRHRRGPRRVAGADLPRRGDHPGDDAPLRRADLRRGRRRRRRHHRQGRPAGAVRPHGLRAARPRLRALPHGARRAQGRREPRRVRSGGWG